MKKASWVRHIAIQWNTRFPCGYSRSLTLIDDQVEGVIRSTIIVCGNYKSRFKIGGHAIKDSCFFITKNPTKLVRIQKIRIKRKQMNIKVSKYLSLIYILQIQSYILTINTLKKRFTNFNQWKRKHIQNYIVFIFSKYLFVDEGYNI